MTKKNYKDKSNPENMSLEEELWSSGYDYIACTDEAGRGPFAGPVVAGAVIMPKGVRIDRLTDSKKLNKNQHKEFVERVKELALSYSIGVVEVEELDKINNIKQTARLAMKRAIEGLSITPNYILVDGTEVINLEIEQKSVIKGDFNSHGISAAAIIAKVYRDELMKSIDEKYNGVYGWSTNSGYQTKGHVEACHKHGLTPHHRKSWRKTMGLFKK